MLKLNLLLVIAELPLLLWPRSENSHIVLWADVGTWVVGIRALVSYVFFRDAIITSARLRYFVLKVCLILNQRKELLTKLIIT